MITFDTALDEVITFVLGERTTLLRHSGQVVVIRDVRGRLRLAVENASDELAPMNDRLRTVLGPYFAGDIIVKSELLAPDAIFGAGEPVVVRGVPVLERVITGAEWIRAPLPNTGPIPPRATLYGIKGGVGRSTVICAWARLLAERGERVLVVDLDLESPGVSTTLVAPESRPDLGIADWLVEEGVGNFAELLVERLIAKSPIALPGPGEVFVAPCWGGGGGDYVAKLARLYLDAPEADGHLVTFAERISRMIDALEAFVRPTVVLLDSRAGIHDIAGIATTRLGAMTFLFAAGTRQTWDGYRALLRTWGRKPAIATEVRDRLRVVAAQVPETDRERYLIQMQTSAYDLFAETLYEEAGPADWKAFNFDVNARDAPHYPIPVYWSRSIQEWDPLKGDVTNDQLRAAFGEFTHAATELLLDRGDIDAAG